MRIKTQFELSKAFQTHESFRLVVAEALGTKFDEEDSSDGPQTFDELAKAFADLGGMVG